MFAGEVANDVLDDWDSLNEIRLHHVRRVKDIRAVWVRNLTSVVDPKRTSPHNVMYCLYAERNDGAELLVHCSEIVHHTLNPSFLPIESHTLTKLVGWESKQCIVRVWSLPSCEEQVGEKLIDELVDLRALVRVPDTNQVCFAPNALVFDLTDGQYTLASSMLHEETSDTPRRSALHSDLRMERSGTEPTPISLLNVLRFMEDTLKWRHMIQQVHIVFVIL